MPALPTVDRWLSGLWAGKDTSTYFTQGYNADEDPPEAPITFEKLLAKPKIAVTVNLGQSSPGVWETGQRYISSYSRRKKTRTKIENFYTREIRDRIIWADNKYFIGYCNNCNGIALEKLLYYDIYDTSDSTWTRHAADGVDEADVPPFYDTWVRLERNGDTYIINDTYNMEFRFKEGDAERFGVWEFTRMLAKYEKLQFVNGLFSLQNWRPDYPDIRTDLRIRFKTRVYEPTANEVEDAYQAYLNEDYFNPDNLSDAFYFSLHNQNLHLLWFERDYGFRATNYEGLDKRERNRRFPVPWDGPRDEGARPGDYWFLRDYTDQAVEEHMNSGLTVSQFLRDERVFESDRPWIEYFQNLRENPMDEGEGYRIELSLPAHVSAPARRPPNPTELAEDEERTGWESGNVGRKRGFSSMSAEVINVLQLECEWLSDITNQEKERKYREARANLTPSDEGFFETQHGKNCVISHEPLFKHLDPNDPSKHEYRFASEEVLVLDCGHLYHKSSLQGWKNNNASWTCPICRQELKRYRALLQMLFI